MKKFFLTFVLTLLLTASITACTSRPSDTGSATGSGNGSVTENSAANSRARGWTDGTGVMRRNGRYYAGDSGKVYDSGPADDIGGDVRRAADDMMNGMSNAVNDMIH